MAGSAIIYAHGVPPVPGLIAAAKAHRCQFIFEAHGDAAGLPRQWMPAYRAGVDGIAIWDCDSIQDSPVLWSVFRRAGTKRRSRGLKQFRCFPPSA